MRNFSKHSFGDIITEIVMYVILIATLYAGAYALYQGGRIAIEVVEYTLDRGEYAECIKWQDYEMEFNPWDAARQSGYYITQWQKDQCDRAGVELNAHVINN